MSRTNNEDLDYDFEEYNFGDDNWDMDGDMEDTPEGDSRTKPGFLRKIFTTVKDTGRTRLQDHNLRRELTKATLPSSYGVLMDEYDAISKEGSSWWREQEKHWKENKHLVKKYVRPYRDLTDAIGLKAFGDWAEEEERQRDYSSPSEEEQDELRVQQIISEAFQAAGIDSESQVESEIRADARTEIVTTAIKHTADIISGGNDVLKSINESLNHVVGYTKQVTYSYQKKSIELQARQLLVQSRMLNVLADFKENAVRELQDIHKVSALPDYLKATVAEQSQQAIVNKVATGVASLFDGNVKSLYTRLGNRVRARSTELWQQLGTTLQMMTEEEDMGLDEGNKSSFEKIRDSIISSYVGKGYDKAQELTMRHVTPRLRRMLEKTPVGAFGTKWSSLLGNSGRRINAMLQEGTTGNELLDVLAFNLFGLDEEAIRANYQVKDDSDFDLQKQAALDNKYKLSITDVIPAWLKRIYGETHFIARGREADDLIWDYKRGTFVSRELMKEELAGRIFNKDLMMKDKENLYNLVDELFQGMISNKSREAVVMFFLKQRNRNKPADYMELFTKSFDADQSIKNELKLVMKARKIITDEQFRLLEESDGKTADLLRIATLNTEEGNRYFAEWGDEVHSKLNRTKMFEDAVFEDVVKDPERLRMVLELGAIRKEGDTYQINVEQLEKIYSVMEDKNYQRTKKFVWDKEDKVYEIEDEVDSKGEELEKKDVKVIVNKASARNLGVSHFNRTKREELERTRLIEENVYGNHGEEGKTHITLSNGKVVYPSDPSWERELAKFKEREKDILPPEEDERIGREYISLKVIVDAKLKHLTETELKILAENGLKNPISYFDIKFGRLEDYQNALKQQLDAKNQLAILEKEYGSHLNKWKKLYGKIHRELKDVKSGFKQSDKNIKYWRNYAINLLDRVYKMGPNDVYAGKTDYSTDNPFVRLSDKPSKIKVKKKSVLRHMPTNLASLINKVKNKAGLGVEVQDQIDENNEKVGNNVFPPRPVGETDEDGNIIRARGGLIPKLAKGGKTPRFSQGGKTDGDADNVVPAELHGGEMVINAQATKLNEKLLQAINKYDAPLIKDGKITEVYKKVIGWRPEWENTDGTISDSLDKLAKQEVEKIANALLIGLPAETIAEAKKVMDEKTKAKGSPLTAVERLKIVGEFQKRTLDEFKDNPLKAAYNLGANLVSQATNKATSTVRNLAGGKDGSNTTNQAIADRVMSETSNIGKQFKDVAKTMWGDLTGAVSNKKGLLDEFKVSRRKTLENAQSFFSMNKGDPNFKQLDIWMEGVDTQPILRRTHFILGLYFDPITMQPINNPSQVTHGVVTSDRTEVLSLRDLVTKRFAYRDSEGNFKEFNFLRNNEHVKEYESDLDFIKATADRIASSQRMNWAKIKYKQIKNWLKDETFDLYTRTGDSPALLKDKIDAGKYINKETGDVIWSHHDLSPDSDVLEILDDGSTKVVLTKNEINFGIFDKDKRQLKISQIKRYRNAAMKRGKEVYDRYLHPHLKKLGNFMFTKISESGEHMVGTNFDSRPIDVFLPGRDTPIITAYMFKNKMVFDMNSRKKGKVIKSHSSIGNHDVYVIQPGEEKGVLKISKHQLADGLYDQYGEPLYLPLLLKPWDRFKQYAQDAVFGRNGNIKWKERLFMTRERRQQVLETRLEGKRNKLAIDVYVQGRPEYPALTADGFRRGIYISADVNNPKTFWVAELIDGPVMNKETGEIVLSIEDIEKGLMDFRGRTITTGFNIHTGGFWTNLKASTALTYRNMVRYNKKIAQKEDDNALTDLYLAKDFGVVEVVQPIVTVLEMERGDVVQPNGLPIKSLVDCVKGIVRAETNEYVITAEQFKKNQICTYQGRIIRPEKLFEKLRRFKNTLFSRIGSWQQQRMADKDKEKKDAEPKTGIVNKVKSRFPWITALMSKVTPVLGLLGAGLSTAIGYYMNGIKGAIIGGLTWLAPIIAFRFMGKGLSAALTAGRTATASMATRMFGTASARVLRAAKASAIVGGSVAAFNYLDGAIDNDPVFNDRYEGQSLGTKVLNADKGSVEQAPQKGFLESIMTNPYAMAGLTAASFLPWGRIGKGIWTGAKAVGTGAMNLVGRLGGMAATTAVSTAPKAVGLMGRIASGAATLGGKIVSGTMNLTRFMNPATLMSGARLGMAAIVGGGTLLALGGALAFGWWAGTKLRQMWEDKKNPWNRFRMAQYGFKAATDEKTSSKVADIEAIAVSKLLKITAKGVSLKDDEKAFDEILIICGIKNKNKEFTDGYQERLPKFSAWFKYRFLRVIASYISALQTIYGKPEMIDLQKLNKEQQIQLLKEVHFRDPVNSPYMVKHSPFESPAETEVNGTDVDVIARKLSAAIRELEDGKPEYKTATPVTKPKINDGLDDDPKVSNKPDSEKSPQQLQRDEMVKQLKTIKENNNQMETMAEEQAKVAKYSHEANEAITKAHVKTIEIQTQQLDKALEKRIQQHVEKEEGFFSRIGSMVNKVFGWGAENGNPDAPGFGGADFGTNVIQQEATANGTTNHTFNGTYTDSRALTTGNRNINKEQKKWMIMTYNAFRNAGLSDNQARALVAEVGRENSFNPNELFGTHGDPANGFTNVGMISWQKDRAKKLIGRLQSKGLISRNGKMPRTQEALDEQARFLVWEMQNETGLGSENLAKSRQFLANPNIDYKTANRILGQNFIKWRYTDAKYRKGHINRDTFYNAVNHWAESSKREGIGVVKSEPVPEKTPQQVQQESITPNAGFDKSSRSHEMFFFGDSIAKGLMDAYKGSGTARVGAPPSEIKTTQLATFARLVPSNKQAISGWLNRIIVVSTGLSNNPAQRGDVSEMLKHFRSLGLTVNVMGVYDGLKTSITDNGVPVNGKYLNSYLHNLCKLFGHRWLGGFNKSKDGVHPESYRIKLDVVVASAKIQTTSVSQMETETKQKNAQKMQTLVKQSGTVKLGMDGKPKSNSVNVGVNSVKAGKDVDIPSSPVVQSSGGKTVVGKGAWNFDKMISTLRKNTRTTLVSGGYALSKGYRAGKPKPAELSLRQCAGYVRVAIDAGSPDGKAIVLGHGSQVVRNLCRLRPDWKYLGTFNPKTYTPQVGDVISMKGHIYGSKVPQYGHVVIWDGTHYISDFIQPNRSHPFPRREQIHGPFEVARCTNYTYSGRVASVNSNPKNTVTPEDPVDLSGQNQKNNKQATQQSMVNSSVGRTINNVNKGNPTGGVTPPRTQGGSQPYFNPQVTQQTSSVQMETPKVLYESRDIQKQMLDKLGLLVDLFKKGVSINTTEQANNQTTQPSAQTTNGINVANIDSVKNRMNNTINTPVPVAKPV